MQRVANKQQLQSACIKSGSDIVWSCHVILTMLRHLYILWLHIISGLVYETLKPGIKMQVSVMM